MNFSRLKTLSQLIAICSLLMGSLNLAHAQLLFHDDFASGDKSKTSDNFKWTGGSGTVTIEQGIDRHGVKKPLMSFKYLAWAGTENDATVWKEQRFKLAGTKQPTPGHSTLYFSFWFRVPDNFAMANAGGDSSNNKFFMIWHDDYTNDGFGATAGMEYRPSDVGAKFYMKTSVGEYTKLSKDTDPVTFIRVPQDRGRWMQIGVELVSESAPYAKDGSMRVWRRWDNDSAPWELTHEWLNRRLMNSTDPNSGGRGWAYGYLFGYANSEFAEDTQFFLDDFKVGTTAESVDITSSSSTVSQTIPVAPQLMVVK